MTEDETATQRFLREADERAAYDSLADDAMTSDAREAFDALRRENTSLATENAKLRAEVQTWSAAASDYAGQTRELLRGRERDADRFLRRIERLRRAVAKERVVAQSYKDGLTEALAHLEADHASMDASTAKLRQHECAIRELVRQRDEVRGALQHATDRVIELRAERDDARRQCSALNRELDDARRDIGTTTAEYRRQIDELVAERDAWKEQANADAAKHSDAADRAAHEAARVDEVARHLEAALRQRDVAHHIIGFLRTGLESMVRHLDSLDPNTGQEKAS